MDWEGRLLTPEGEVETAKFLVTPRRPYTGQEIVVAASYQVTGSRRQIRNAHFDVEYRTWGRLIRHCVLRGKKEEFRINPSVIANPTISFSLISATNFEKMN
jgi:hypothetical protein